MTRARLSRVACACCLIATPAAAQGTAARRAEMTAGSWQEHRIIDASVAGMPIALRPFGPLVLDRLTGDTATRAWELAPAWGGVWYHTARASIGGEGAVRPGRGFTAAASAGIVGRWRMLSYALRPVAYWTENRDYRPSESVGTPDFQNPWMRGEIDLPYRWGDGAHHRLDWGESQLRVDTRWVAAGISTGAQMWGPARLNPLVLSGAGGGFPHVFIETGTPRPIGIGHVATRWMAGRIDASEVPVTGGRGARMGIGLVGSFVPRGMPGLEVGAARFFHLYDSPVARDFQSLTLPFSGLLKSGLGNVDRAGARNSNQLGSVFARIAPPGSALELYGELYREDHSWDARDLVGEPDHATAYMLGVRRSGGARGTSVTIEAVNGRISHIQGVRHQGPMYRHTQMREGHTNRGVALGSPMLPGGGGLEVRIDRSVNAAAWFASAQVVRLAQSRQGGTFEDDVSGYVSVGGGYERPYRGGRWAAELSLQPGFGDIPGTNVLMGIRAGMR